MSEENKEFAIRVRAVIYHENKLLVVKHLKELDFYALPGGKLEYGEKIQDCLKREIFEELGIQPQVSRLLYINNFIDTNNKQSIEFFFEVTNAEDYLDIEKLKGSHSFELYEIKWIDAKDECKILPKLVETDLKQNTILSDTVKFI